MPRLTCFVQLDASLESNKTEKHQKEVFKRFFVSLGFNSLEAHTDVAPATGVTPVSTSRLAKQGMNCLADGEEIQWPDLHDVNIE
jgi:hypothetical protein